MAPKFGSNAHSRTRSVRRQTTLLAFAFLMLFYQPSAEARIAFMSRMRPQPLALHTVTLTSGSSWKVPSGVTTLISVEAWGGGGGAGGRNQGYSCGGGGGGAYARVENLAVTPGQTINYSVGAGGLSYSHANGDAGGDTWFVNTSTLLAKGGGGGFCLSGNYNGGSGGSAASSVGTVKFSGGSGGAADSYGGGSGGAAASPSGNGGNGLASTNNNGRNGGSSPSAGAGGSGGFADATWPDAGAMGGVHAQGGGGGGAGGANTNASGGPGASGGVGGFPGGGAGGPGANLNSSQNSDVSGPGGGGQIVIKYFGPAPTSSDPCAGKQIGETCSGTTAIYAGTYRGRRYMVTPGGCTNSATPTCSGGPDSVQKSWRGSSGGNSDISGLINIQNDSSPSPRLGDDETPIIVADGSISNDSAAHYCSNMNYGGYTDWYLPSKSELGYLYCISDGGTSHDTNFPDEFRNCVPFGGKQSLITGFRSAQYWSSSEQSSSNARMQSFTNGGTFGGAKSTSAYVRCVRSY